MNIRLTIDKAGRVVIPKPLRKELHLEPGDSLEMESAGELITLRPVRGTGPLSKEHGVWVFHSGQPLPATATDEMLEQLREEREIWRSSFNSTNRPAAIGRSRYRRWRHL